MTKNIFKLLIKSYIVRISIVLGVMCSLLCIPTYSDEIVTIDNTEELIINVNELSKDEILLQMDLYYQYMETAHNMAENARFLGYDESHIVITTAQSEWQKSHRYYMCYLEAYELINQNVQIDDSCFDEYPIASEVWVLLKDYDLSDYVCAGIIGNMMTECGGNTLSLNSYIYNPSGYYYGLCQWNRGAYPSVFDCDTESQIIFLMNSIKYELDTYGNKYYRGFNYNVFLQMTDEQDVALAFAKCYERCGSGSYTARQRNATTAYNYFVK